MALDKHYSEPTFHDFGDTTPFLPFIAGLAGQTDCASSLTRDLYVHTHMLVAHDMDGNLLRSHSDVLQEVLNKIGEMGWKALHTLHEYDSEAFWRALRNQLDMPKVESASLGEWTLIQ